MNRKTSLRIVVLAGLLVLLCSGVAYASGTYQQGYSTGCDIAQGVYGEDTGVIYGNTLNWAWNVGLFEYALGVMDGYFACGSGGGGGV